MKTLRVGSRIPVQPYYNSRGEEYEGYISVTGHLIGLIVDIQYRTDVVLINYYLRGRVLFFMDTPSAIDRIANCKWTTI